MVREVKSTNKPILPILIFGIMSLIALLTHYQGGADILDYSDGAKYFSGEYAAKIRSSHSYAYSFLHILPVKLFENFFFFKITSLLSLAGLVYSVYRISGRDPKSLWLMILAPISWYMSPWISPIQLSSLLFLWCFYHIKKYDSLNSLKSLFISSMLAGLSWVFWDGVLFFTPLLMISFLYDKKFSHVLYYLAGVLIGFMPRLVADQILFDFAFFGVLRHISASLAFAIFGGIYNQGSLSGISKFILSIAFFPLCTYLLFKKKIFNKTKKTAFFIILSIIIVLINSQIRFVLIIFPIIVISLAPYISKRVYKIQLVYSIILILLIVNPYIIQLSYETNLSTIETFPMVYNIIYFKEYGSSERIKEDLNQIAQEHPHNTFVVGNSPEDYRILANLYWGKEIQEFVSIEDYNLYLSGESNVFSKDFCPNISINERRKICVQFSIEKTDNDKTDYSSIKYLIVTDGESSLSNFKLLKRYNILSLYEKESI